MTNLSHLSGNPHKMATICIQAATAGSGSMRHASQAVCDVNWNPYALGPNDERITRNQEGTHRAWANSGPTLKFAQTVFHTQLGKIFVIPLTALAVSDCYQIKPIQLEVRGYV
jgi:hypothetical protein